MKDPNKLCPGCMNEWADHNRPCPSCGFSWETYERPARWLPARTILSGKYMVGKAIGEGGFGITYLGWDLNLQVRVAIKEYFPVGLATRETGNGKSNTIRTLSGERRENYRQGLEKFMTEAQNLSKFYNLKGIVAVRDFFFENETAYMVMEFIDGITLGTYLKQHGGQISEQEVLQLFHPVMTSLQVVHQAGIVHRDISPDNIMMTKDGHVKLIDFGAARFAGGDKERSLTIILKHGYAPAEQYQSRGNQGPWTDVYALCATMYRMLTGKVPPSAMDRFHEDKLEEFKALGCNVSDKTAYALIDKGMALKVADRYQNMQELVDGLYSIQSGKVKRIKKKKTINLPLIIGASAAAACLVIGGGVFAAKKWQDSMQAQRGQTVQMQGGDSLNDESNSSETVQGDMAGQTQVDLENKIYTEEELAQKQEEAAAFAAKISGAESHLVFAQEDGTVKGVGTDSYDSLSTEKWSDIKAVSTSSFQTVGLKNDGTVVFTGNDSYGKQAVRYWKDVEQIVAGDTIIIGIKKDGTLMTTGANELNNQGNYFDIDLTGWKDIAGISVGRSHILGVFNDGTVIGDGRHYEGQYAGVEEWEDIAAVAAGEYYSIGLKKDGSIVMTGKTDGMEEASQWQQIIAVTAGNGFVAGLTANGHVLVAGSDSEQQKAAESWKDVKAIAACDKILFGMKEDGSIIKTTYECGTVTRDEMTDLVKVVAGGPYLVGIKKDGTVVTWGKAGDDSILDVSGWTDIIDVAVNEYGVLGLKSDGTAVVTGIYQEAGDGVKDWTGIVDVQMTARDAVGIKADGTVYLSEPEAGRVHEERKYTGNQLLFASYPFYIDAYEGQTGGSYTDRRSILVSVGENNEYFAYGNEYPERQGSYANMREWGGEVVSLAVGYEEHEDDNRWNELVVAVLADGTVECHNDYIGKHQRVSDWENITEVACGAGHIVGLKADGTVEATGDNSNGQCDVDDWTEIVSVTAGEFFTAGVKADGTLLIAGKVPGEY